MNILKNLFNSEGIEYFASLKLEDTRIINQSLFDRKTCFAKSVTVFLIPYYTGEDRDRNISRYAVSLDYHILISQLTERIIGKLKQLYPNNSFAGMGDNSPIDERDAAAKAGLGILGDNRCLINEKYGSYLFIAEIFSDLEAEGSPAEIKGCIHCARCKKACPSPDHCLSDLTQQKGELTEKTAMLMRRYGTAWGCDICQEVCPMNQNAKRTPIRFFYEDRISQLTPEILKSMSDKELSERAYGWRKRKTIERNIKILSEQ